MFNVCICESCSKLLVGRKDGVGGALTSVEAIPVASGSHYTDKALLLQGVDLGSEASIVIFVPEHRDRCQLRNERTR